MQNPYQSPNAVTFKPERIAIIRPRRLDWLLWTLAFFPAVSIYFTWLVAWLTLGHQPRPSLDDPKHIGVAVSAVYLISGLCLPLIPVVAIVGPFVQLIAAGRSLAIRAIYAVISVIASVSTILLLRWDPLRVVFWFMD